MRLNGSRILSYFLPRAALVILLSSVLNGFSQQSFDLPSSHYSVSSIRGNFGVVATYGANIARALGTQTFDGEGKLKGSALVNQPGPNRSRSISHISFSGTYTVNADGTGAMTLDLNLANGQITQVVEDFVVTKAVTLHGFTTATELVDVQRVPSAAIDSNVLVTHTYTRRAGLKRPD